jgi:hypothetical protein
LLGLFLDTIAKGDLVGYLDAAVLAEGDQAAISCLRSFAGRYKVSEFFKGSVFDAFYHMEEADASLLLRRHLRVISRLLFCFLV